VTGMDSVGIPTVMVTRPNSRSLSVSQGKGADLVSAKVSGIFESVEQWHAERIALPLRLARPHELEHVVDVGRLPGYVEQYDPSVRTLWVEGEELGTGLPCWVPLEMVQLDFTLPLPAGSGYFMPGSNGLASGTSLVEAAVHGVCELIERDAQTLFYGLPWPEQWRRRLDLDSVIDAKNRALLAAFEEAEVDVAVWEITSDVGAPAYLCSILERRRDPFRPVGLARGSGAHVDAGAALTRALTEAAQSRLTRIVGTRDDIQGEDFERLRSEHKFEEGRRQIAAPGRPPRAFQPTLEHRGTLEEDLLWLKESLAHAGMPQLVVVDLSRPGLPIAVARVVVPGLESPSETPGYRPGERARRALERLEP
jgi:YcaO-like protein with predicted kinase domain